MLSYLLHHRTNKVITSLGPTLPYSVEDGVDQGETISPLLWKIYYDPLISRIHTEHQGFIGEIPSIRPKEIHTSVMAYMDDSLWIAPDKTFLTNILHTASSFYNFANIKVNPTKSILATNSKDLDNSITFENEQLTAIANGTPFKYLGAWFSTNKKQIPVQKEIIAEATINLKKLQFAYITEKQAIYIINSVIFPCLLYRLHSIFLSNTQINTLNKICTSLVKHKARLAQGVPNSFLFNPDIYALSNLAQAQLSSLVTILQKNLSHHSFDSLFLKL